MTVSTEKFEPRFLAALDEDEELWVEWQNICDVHQVPNEAQAAIVYLLEENLPTGATAKKFYAAMLVFQRSFRLDNEFYPRLVEFVDGLSLKKKKKAGKKRASKKKEPPAPEPNGSGVVSQPIVSPVVEQTPSPEPATGVVPWGKW
jgi:hypothetical protein